MSSAHSVPAHCMLCMSRPKQTCAAVSGFGDLQMEQHCHCACCCQQLIATLHRAFSRLLACQWHAQPRPQLIYAAHLSVSYQCFVWFTCLWSHMYGILCCTLPWFVQLCRHCCSLCIPAASWMKMCARRDNAMCELLEGEDDGKALQCQLLTFQLSDEMGLQRCNCLLIHLSALFLLSASLYCYVERHKN